jgi:hypothetical protein
MPAEQRFGLEEVGGVFPGLNAAGQQDEPETIRLSEVGPFDLAIVSGIPQGSNSPWSQPILVRFAATLAAGFRFTASNPKLFTTTVSFTMNS